MENFFRVMLVDVVEGIELVAYQLKEVVNQWLNEWEDLKGDNAEPSVWGKFVETFLDRFFPQELRESKAKNFINLKQGKMSVKEYTLNFNQLAHYAIELIENMRAYMRKFAFGLSDDLVLEFKGES